MKRHLITGLFLLAALGCYAVGAATWASFFVVVGGSLELVFWIRFLNLGRKQEPLKK